MDPLDAALMRGILRDGVFDIPGIDPRHSVSYLAREVGLSRNSVRARLDSWRETGFLSRFSVYVNPDLVGRKFVGQYSLVRDPSHLTEIEKALARSPRLFLVYFGSLVEREIAVSMLRVVRDSSDSEAEVRAIAAIPNIQLISTPFDIPFPHSSVELRPLDWQLVRHLRDNPDLAVPALAAKLRRSARQIRRRMDALLDGNALFIVPNLDLTKSRGSVLNITVFFDQETDHAALMAKFRAIFPDLVPLTRRVHAELLLPPQIDGTQMSYTGFFLPVRAGQLAGDVTVALRSVEGVREAAVGYAIRNYEIRQCYDRILAEAATASPPPPRLA